MKKNAFIVIILITISVYSNNDHGFLANCNDCDSCEACPEFMPSPMPSTYAMNAPYKIDLAPCPWNIFVSSSFLYWTASQDGMLAYTQCIETALSPIDGIANEAREYNQGEFDCDYHPGFKLGLGWQSNCDNWELFASYLWYHHSFTNSLTLPEIDLAIQEAQLIPTFSVNPTIYETSLLNPSKLFSKWNINIDLLDLETARTFYVGKCLLFRTAYGLRNVYISQEMNQKANVIIKVSQGYPYSEKSKQEINSWGLGPKVGLDCKWLLNCGFSISGKTAVSLLFTQYTLKAKEFAKYLYTSGALIYNANSKLETLNPCAIRPYLDLGIGLNWETYLNCRRWHLNVYTGYDFMALWNQNMFRVARGIPGQPPTGQAGKILNMVRSRVYQLLSDDLYLQGLTVSATFSF